MVDEECEYFFMAREGNGDCKNYCRAVIDGVCDSDDYESCQTYLAVKEWEKKSRGLLGVVDG
ncbi:MAG: hypothetical protein V1889_00510 [archaeon]